MSGSGETGDKLKYDKGTTTTPDQVEVGKDNKTVNRRENHILRRT